MEESIRYAGGLLSPYSRKAEAGSIPSSSVAYIAGIIDGEGTITLSKTAGYRTPNISIASNDIEILEFVEDYYGGTLRLKVKATDIWKAQYQWTLKGRKAISMIEDVLPFLRSPKKVSRASYIVDNYDNVVHRNGFYTQEERLVREKFDKDFFLF